MGTVLQCLLIGISFVLPQRSAISAPGGSPDEVKARVAELNALAAHRVTLPAIELRRTLEAGIGHADASVRRAALWAVAGRAGGVRFSRTPDLVERHAAEAPVLRQLRPLVIQALQDDEDNVRHAALIALGNLDVQPSQARQGVDVEVSLDTAEILRRHYATERSPFIRGEIVKAFALSRTRDAARDRIARQVFESALTETDSIGLQHAIHGAALLRDPLLLPRVAALLSHREAIVRIAAAETFPAYGLPAKAYLPDLRHALSVEQNAVAAKTLEGAIAGMRKIK